MDEAPPLLQQQQEEEEEDVQVMPPPPRPMVQTPPKPPPRPKVASDLLEGDDITISPGGYALPPASQIDTSVLDALPPDLREQVEAHIEERNHMPLFHSDLTMSQIDKPTLQALPEALRREVLASLCPKGRTGGGGGKLSRSSSLTGGVGRPQAPRQVQTRMDWFGLGVEGVDAEYWAQLPLDARHDIMMYPKEHKRAMEGGGGGGVNKLTAPSPPPRAPAPPRTGGKWKEASPARVEVVVEAEADQELDDGVEVAVVVPKKQEEKTKKVNSRPRLFVEEEVEDVRRALLQWLGRIHHKSGAPDTAHLQLLATYLLERVDDDREDDMWTVMRAFRRWVQQPGHKAWRPAYRAVLGALERRVFEKERHWEQQQGWPVCTLSTDAPCPTKLAGLQL